MNTYLNHNEKKYWKFVFKQNHNKEYIIEAYWNIVYIKINELTNK